MKIFLKVILYIIAIAYIILALTLSIDYVLFFDYISISLYLVVLLLIIDFFYTKEKDIKKILNFFLYILFVTCIFPLISAFIFLIFRENFFLLIGNDLPVGILSGVIFLVVDYFLRKKFIGKKLFIFRLIVLIPIFIIATFLFVIIEYGEIIKPLKEILDIE